MLSGERTLMDPTTKDLPGMSRHPTAGGQSLRRGGIEHGKSLSRRQETEQGRHRTHNKDIEARKREVIHSPEDPGYDFFL